MKHNKLLVLNTTMIINTISINKNAKNYVLLKIKLKIQNKENHI